MKPDDIRAQIVCIPDGGEIPAGYSPLPDYLKDKGPFKVPRGRKGSIYIKISPYLSEHFRKLFAG